MANVLHRTRRPTDYRLSVNTPDFPVGQWFINPDVSAVANVPQKYWTLSDPVQEMSLAEKQLVDGRIAAAERYLPLLGTTRRLQAERIGISSGTYQAEILEQGDLSKHAGNYGPLRPGEEEVIVQSDRGTQIVVALTFTGELFLFRRGIQQTFAAIQEAQTLAGPAVARPAVQSG